MESLGNDHVLGARQLPFQLFVEGWPGTHISLGEGANNCMGFSMAVLEDGDCISFPQVAERSITHSGEPGVSGSPCYRQLAAQCAHGLAKQREEFAEENLSRAVQHKDTTFASERP